MTPQEISNELVKQFKELQFVEGVKLAVSGKVTGDPAIIIPADKLLLICKTLKESKNFSFDCLSNLTAVDRKDRFEMVYHLFSYSLRHEVTLKVVLPRDETAHIETVERLWACANWLEREVYDLFGIKFDGHSDLRRIMLPDDWVGHPLRKDYKEAEDYHGISTTRPSLLQ